VPTLREVQAAFARGVLDPALSGGIAGGIVGDGIAPERRLGVYRNNVLVSLRGVLERSFPATRRRLGPKRFAALAESFIRAAPPARPQLSGYGAGFPAFLERSIEDAALPWLADVARLEWAREEAYYAADARPLALTALASIPLECYPELCFEPHPSLRLICSAGPIFALWRAALDDAADESAAAVAGGQGEQVLVVRPEMTVTTRPIVRADLFLVEALAEDLPLAEAAARAVSADAGFDLQAALALHLAGGSFAACH
jgi:Putative DNA-binding domain